MNCYFCLLDLRSGECNFVSLYILGCPVNGSVCFVCLTVFVNCLDKSIYNMFGCVCYFVAECDVVVCGWRCSIG